MISKNKYLNYSCILLNHLQLLDTGLPSTHNAVELSLLNQLVQFTSENAIKWVFKFQFFIMLGYWVVSKSRLFPKPFLYYKVTFEQKSFIPSYHIRFEDL